MITVLTLHSGSALPHVDMLAKNNPMPQLNCSSNSVLVPLLRNMEWAISCPLNLGDPPADRRRIQRIAERDEVICTRLVHSLQLDNPLIGGMWSIVRPLSAP